MHVRDPRAFRRPTRRVLNVVAGRKLHRWTAPHWCDPDAIPFRAYSKIRDPLTLGRKRCRTQHIGLARSEILRRHEWTFEVPILAAEPDLFVAGSIGRKGHLVTSR